MLAKLAIDWCRMKHKRQSLVGKNGEDKGGKSGSCTNDEDSMDMDGTSGKGGHESGSETGLDLDKSALSPDDSNHSQSSKDETIPCEKPSNSTPLSLIDPNSCCAEVVPNRTLTCPANDCERDPTVTSPKCEDIKISNSSQLLHSALSSVTGSPVTRTTLGSPGVTISPKGHQSPSEHSTCAPIHSVTKVRNWTPNTRQPLNTLNTIECHPSHANSAVNSMVSTSVNSTALPVQTMHGQHPPNGCTYYGNRCLSTTSSSLSSSSSTLSYGRRQRYSSQMTSRSSPSNPALPQSSNFCYRGSPSDNFGNVRTAQQNTCVSAQDPLATKFFSSPNIANGGTGSLYAASQQSPQSTVSTVPTPQLQQRSHYFATDYNCDYTGGRNEPQSFPQRPYDSPFMDGPQQGEYATNGATIAYASHASHANHTNHANHANQANYANLVTQANQMPDHESFSSENNARAQTTVNTYTNAGYYDLAVNPSDTHRIPSEYNAIALKQQPNEYSSHSQSNSSHQQYYDIQNSGTGLAVAVSPNIPTFDQNYCSSTGNSSDPTATCYNTYANSNYYDVYPNCTSAMANNEFNFINIANEFASPEYYQLS